MKKTMLRKLTYLIFMIAVFTTTGCIKETYNMNKLSEKVHLSPTVGISAISGSVSLINILKPNDTVRIDQNKFVKIVFKQDSVQELKLDDVYTLNNMVAFSKSFTIGELSIDPFSRTLSFPLSLIVTKIPNPLGTQISSLNNTTSIFPPFPAAPATSITMTETPFPISLNFDNAVFSTGSIDISVKNNLPVPISNIKIQLFNSVGHTSIGTQQTIALIPPFGTGVATIDLANQTVKSVIALALSFAGNGSGSTLVPINLNTNKLDITIVGSNLKVRSGRVTLPGNNIPSLNSSGSIAFTPGNNVEIDKINITSGNFSYKIQKPSALLGQMTVSLPKAFRNGVAVSNQINMTTGLNVNGDISFNNTITNLGSDPLQPFNKMPYSLSVSTSGMIDFSSTDVVKIEFQLLNPVFNYVKGYFGQTTQTFAPDSIDLGIADILNRLKGSFLISSPLIRFNYSNSFGIPFKLAFNATGRRGPDKINLDRDTILINSPADSISRNVTGSITIDKTNSHLPALISMLPEVITFSGAAKMNPSVNPLLPHPMNNYVFGNSRFIIDSLEVEVPLEFRINNLQFADTVNNFLKDAGGSGNSSVKVENFKLLRVNLDIKNGFPLGLSAKMILYNSVSKTNISTVDVTGLLGPAPVGIDGKANGVTESKTTIELTKDFFSSIDAADKVIIQFTLNTTDNTTKDVKFYSDYKIDYNASVVVQPDINLK
jgi:hypothetical protein